jgi:hypothetical protein
MDTGIVGAKHLLPALSEMGRTDIALMVALQETQPSYGYMIGQGATTLWEAWTGTRYQPDPGGSWNHVMFASVSDWFYKYLAGLQIALGSSSRGWQRVEIYPHVWIPAINDSICANLSFVSASIMTPRGLLAASWNCNVTLPAPPPPACAKLPGTMRFVSNGDDMCTKTKDKANCGVFLEDAINKTKHHVVACAMIVQPAVLRHCSDRPDERHRCATDSRAFRLRHVWGGSSAGIAPVRQGALCLDSHRAHGSNCQSGIADDGRGIAKYL